MLRRWAFAIRSHATSSPVVCSTQLSRRALEEVWQGIRVGDSPTNPNSPQPNSAILSPTPMAPHAGVIPLLSSPAQRPTRLTADPHAQGARAPHGGKGLKHGRRSEAAVGWLRGGPPWIGFFASLANFLRRALPMALPPTPCIFLSVSTYGGYVSGLVCPL